MIDPREGVSGAPGVIPVRQSGTGEIGGKAAGLLRAARLLAQAEPAEGLVLHDVITAPACYCIATGRFDEFLSLNGLGEVAQLQAQVRGEHQYADLRAAFLRAGLPDDLAAWLRLVLREIGAAPLIARSSSQLEDRLGITLAGQYESVLCPNAGGEEANFEALCAAIKQVYASTFRPEALAYRRKLGLLQQPERMAVLIQAVQGSRHGDYFLPAVAGVGLSRNPFRWTTRIRREDGMLRMVCGLGARAVMAQDNDYPRLVALSHPLMRPERTVEEIEHYSQHFVDAIDLVRNRVVTLPVRRLLATDFPAAPYIVSSLYGDDLSSGLSSDLAHFDASWPVTFEGLLKNTPFAAVLKSALHKLEAGFGHPVNIEFTAEIMPRRREGQLSISLLQCRPVAGLERAPAARIPRDVPGSDQVFSTRKLVPQGVARNIRYIIYVDPDQYDRIPDRETRIALGWVIGRLNQRLADENYILIGPGRWGSTNLALGIPVAYSDVNHARVIVEMVHGGDRFAPDVAYGTHFFLDLVESGIYPLPILLGDQDTCFNAAFFAAAPNILPQLLPDDSFSAACIKVIEVPEIAAGRMLHVVMDGERDEALAYLGPAVPPD